MTSDRSTVLIQLDADPLPSVFDRVVAVDAGVDHLFAYSNVTPDNVESLVHGAMFTRGPKHLHRTAIFIGGSDVVVGEAILERVNKTFFGPMRVSVMLDANGANTTAVAAVLCAADHLTFSDTTALVLGGTGPVGQRVARLLAAGGATVRLASRSADRANAAADRINDQLDSPGITGVAVEQTEDLADALAHVQLVVSAGAAGVTLLPENARQQAGDLQLVIDLNAVPPVGIEGVEPTDSATERDGVLAYGALGVGGRKMKIHKAAIKMLFDSNEHILDAPTIYDLAVNQKL